MIIRIQAWERDTLGGAYIPARFIKATYLGNSELGRVPYDLYLWHERDDEGDM